MLYPTMINFEANANALAERPYVRMLDLAKVAMIRFEDLEGGSAAIQVTNSILQYWNIDEETLFEQCHKNAAKNYPPVVTNICNMLHEMAEEKQIDDADLFLDLMDEDSPMQMYVITNWRKNFGAEAICNLPLLHQLSMKKDADLFIFPSSVHELILCMIMQKVAVDLLLKELRRLMKHRYLRMNVCLTVSINTTDSADRL